MQKVSVGFSRTDITPMESVPLAGFGNTARRMSGPVLSPLLATCLAFSDGQKTLLFYTLDFAGFSSKCNEIIRPAISQATGIPVAQIHLSCSHCHSSPDMANVTIPAIPRYNKQLEAKLVLAALDAMADLTPTRIYVSAVETSGLNFVRNYVRQDGTYCGSNFGNLSDSPIVGHESEADRMLQLVYFLREGKQAVLLANFQGHPHRLSGGSDPTITADIVGFFRSEMERRTGCLLAYATGGSGNENSVSRIKEEMAAPEPYDHGKILADFACRAFRNFKEVGNVGVDAAELVLELPLNHTQDHLVPEAEKIQALWQAHNDTRLCAIAGAPYGINSPYHAGAILRKAKMAQSFPLSIYALKVGDVGIAVAPYEMYDSNGLQIKEASPFALTVIATCANTIEGYVPSALGWEHGGYSCDTTRFCPGSGEELAGHYINLLTKLKEDSL